MTISEEKIKSLKWADANRIRWEAANRNIPIDLVSALAGDRLLTESEKTYIEEMKYKWGIKFYSLILYIITHHHFPAETSEDLWSKILKHKYEMSSMMKRNIRITVATLDLLSNLTDEMRAATVIDENQMSDIIQLSLRDGLTGLFNHTSCFQRIDLELNRYLLYGTPVSLLMIDIDDFKDINDRYGHLEGDKILTMIGSIIIQMSRDVDICCRYGGEEFAIIMSSTEAHEAVVLAERLRIRIEQSLEGGRAVTVSIGVASSYDGVSTSMDLIRKADTALYRAKRNGKNRVEAWE